MQPEPFQINVAQEILDDLKRRLARTRWTDEVNGAGWDYGTNLSYLKELAAYWQEKYNWRTQEAALNQLHHFKVEVDGLSIHFIHERGKGSNPMPIILSHGWPDSFYRFVKVIPMLSDPASYGGEAADSFDVIVPSLPGYGFSERPHEPGMNQEQMAELWTKLMTDVLGYHKFAAAAGDMGRTVTERLAWRHPELLYGIHLTDMSYNIQEMPDPSTLSEAEKKYMEAGQKWGMAEGAYGMIQGTKPQTLSYGLNDSPVGLAGWLVEKFRAWSDCNGDVEKRFSKDELLTNLMIYWVTETINSANRLYKETLSLPQMKADEHIDVPAAFAIFPKDMVPLPRESAERVFNVQRWTEMPRGGHFAAFEEPELYAEDVRAFFRQFRS